MQLQDNQSNCENEYQKHVAGSLQNIIAPKGGMCNDVAYLLSWYFLSSEKHRNFTRNPPENRRFPTHYGESETHACGGRTRLQIEMQKRKEIESRLRQCSAKTNEKVNQQTCLLGFSFPFLDFISIFTTSGTVIKFIHSI